MSERPLDRLLAWLPLAIVCAVALGRALTAVGPPRAPAADAATRRAAFVDLATHEREMRQQAAKEFPTDPWSQDDSFHALERQRAVDFARARHVRLEDVLDAYDEGLRERWSPLPLAATVPPCRPRAIY